MAQIKLQVEMPPGTTVQLITLDVGGVVQVTVPLVLTAPTAVPVGHEPPTIVPPPVIPKLLVATQPTLPLPSIADRTLPFVEVVVPAANTTKAEAPMNPPTKRAVAETIDFEVSFI